MGGHDEPVAVDVVAPFEVPDYRQYIVCVGVERGRLRPSAALADAALVVAQHKVAGFGQRPGQLGEDRHSGQVLVAVHQADSRHQQHGRPTARRPFLDGGRGDACRKAETARAHADIRLARGAARGQARGHQRQILPGHVELQRREVHPQQPVVLVHPDVGVQPLRVVLQLGAIDQRRHLYFRGLNRLDPRPPHNGRNLSARRDVHRNLFALCLRAEPHRQRLVCAKEEIGKYDRVRRDLDRTCQLVAALPDLVRCRAVRKCRENRELAIIAGAVDVELERLPILVVVDLERADVEVYRRAELTDRVDAPAVVGTGDAHALHADRNGTDEDGEDGFAGGRRGAILSFNGGAGE